MQEIEKLQNRLKTAKTTIFIVAFLTIVNTLLIAFNADISFTFSAYVPQVIAAVFAEIAVEEGAMHMLYIGVAIAVAIALVYLGVWAGARKKDVFIIVALVIFGIDSAILLFDLVSYFDVSFLIDVAFHAWVIVDLALGISARSKLKRLAAQNGVDVESFVSNYAPNEEQSTSDVQNYDFGNSYNTPNISQEDSTPIGISENKGRVLISSEYNSMNVEVRRSKGLTELIVDGNVYAEKHGVFESEYTLYARVSGVMFTLTMSSSSVMYLYADGQLIAKKMRLI